MKLNFVWYWDRALEIAPNWRDGLRAALEELGKEHHVEIYLGKVEPPDDSDFLLFWDDSNSPFFDKLDNYKCKKGIILTTDPVNFENLAKLDVVYCESTPVYEAVRSHGLRAIKAFGCDSNFYKPVEPNGSLTLGKDIEYFYPATFSPWKKQSSIAYLGSKLVCIGTVQPDGQSEFQECLKNGVQIQEGYFPPEVIRSCYARAKFIPIPAIHGSERTVLEAMSMNLVPTVNPKNVRTNSYLEEYIHSEYLTPRDFILANYSTEIYAAQLLKGMV